MEEAEYIDKPYHWFHGKPFEIYIKDKGVLQNPNTVIVCLGCERHYRLGNRICNVYGKDKRNIAQEAQAMFHRCPFCGASWYVYEGAARGIYLGMVDA